MSTETTRDVVVAEARELARYVKGLAAGLQDVRLGQAGDALTALADECEASC